MKRLVAVVMVLALFLSMMSFAHADDDDYMSKYFDLLMGLYGIESSSSGSSNNEPAYDPEKNISSMTDEELVELSGEITTEMTRRFGKYYEISASRYRCGTELPAGRYTIRILGTISGLAGSPKVITHTFNSTDYNYVKKGNVLHVTLDSDDDWFTLEACYGIITKDDKMMFE